jgi:hypothetical protein
VAVGPKDGDGAGEEHRTEVPYQVTTLVEHVLGRGWRDVIPVELG